MGNTGSTYGGTRKVTTRSKSSHRSKSNTYNTDDNDESHTLNNKSARSSGARRSIVSATNNRKTRKRKTKHGVNVKIEEDKNNYEEEEIDDSI